MAQLLDLTVLPEHRRKGHGSTLITAFIEQAAAYGRASGILTRRLWVSVEQKTQVNARAFLTRHGFHHVATIHELLAKQDWRWSISWPWIEAPLAARRLPTTPQSRAVLGPISRYSAKFRYPSGLSRKIHDSPRRRRGRGEIQDNIALRSAHLQRGAPHFFAQAQASSFFSAISASPR